MNKTYTEYLLRLCICAVTGQTPPPSEQPFDCGEFFAFCCGHKLENIAYSQMQRAGIKVRDEREEMFFKDKYNQSVHNSAVQQYYLERITEAFEENGIDYLVLKGMVMKELYPSADMRECADIDIYIGGENAQRARDVMEGIGFENDSFGALCPTDNYHADKLSHVELHRVLIPNGYKWTDECNKIPERLIRKDNHRLEMSAEDFYIFMICHLAKHLKCGGAGIRAVLDIWIYLREREEKLDWKYINDFMERCGIAEFHRNITELWKHWFENEPADRLAESMAAYIASSGWDGNSAQWKSSGVKSGAVGKSRLMLRLELLREGYFLPETYMTEKYPILNKHPRMMPLCRIHRLFKGLATKRGTVAGVIHSCDDVLPEEITEINAFRKSMGL